MQIVSRQSARQSQRLSSCAIGAFSGSRWNAERGFSATLTVVTSQRTCVELLFVRACYMRVVFPRHPAGRRKTQSTVTAVVAIVKAPASRARKRR